MDSEKIRTITMCGVARHILLGLCQELTINVFIEKSKPVVECINANCWSMIVFSLATSFQIRI